MSLSSQFRQTQQDAQDKVRADEIAEIGKACSYIADHFAGAAKGIAARALKDKEKTWFQKRHTEKWLWSIEGLTRQELSSPGEIFENIPGFRKLRDACAAPENDVHLRVYISIDHTVAIHICVDPTRPFSESTFSSKGVSIPITTAAPPPPPAPPAAVAAPSERIVVMSPLRLK